MAKMSSHALQHHQTIYLCPEISGEQPRDHSTLILPPPLEIGRVISAHSSMRFSDGGLNIPRRAAWTLAILGSSQLLAWTIHLFWPTVSQFPYHGPVLSLVGLIAAVVFWIQTRPHGVCTFVGELGMARVSCGGCFSRRRTETLLFQEAESLEKASAPMGREERYLFPTRESADACMFTWRDRGGHPLFQVLGLPHAGVDHPEAEQDFLFGCVAEEVWTRKRLYDAAMFLYNNQPVTFPLVQGDEVRVEPERLVFRFGQQERRIAHDEIEEAWREESHLVLALTAIHSREEGERPLLRFALEANELLFLTLFEAMTGLKPESRVSQLVVTHQVRDPLTGLPGRVLFNDRLETEVTRHARSGGRFALMVVKLDNLTRINHCLDPACGGETVVGLARRLGELASDPGAVARLGEGEFAILMDMPVESSPTLILRHFRKQLTALVKTSEGMVKPKLAIGCAVYPVAGETTFALLCSARKAAIAGILGEITPTRYY